MMNLQLSLPLSLAAHATARGAKENITSQRNGNSFIILNDRRIRKQEQWWWWQHGGRWWLLLLLLG
jgi:hypothetical protein